MNYADLCKDEAALELLENEAQVATERLMDAVPMAERTDVFGIMLSTVTNSAFLSQVLCRQCGIRPHDWKEHYLSCVATALLQFNYDTFQGTKEEIAAQCMQDGMRFGEFLVDVITKMMTQAPDVPAQPLNS